MQEDIYANCSDEELKEIFEDIKADSFNSEEFLLD